MSYVTLSDVYQNSRFRTGSSTGDWPDNSAALLSLANKHYRKIVLRLQDSNEDWYATITTVALSNGGSPYNLSSDSSLSGGGTIRVLRFEVSYDNGVSYAVATGLPSRTDIGTPTILTADVANTFSTDEPFYALYNNQIHLFPDATTTSTARLFQVIRRKEFGASTDIFGDADASGIVQLPKEFMELMEEYITADLYERMGKTQEALATRNYADKRLETVCEQYSPRVNDLELAVSFDHADYGE